MAKYMDSGGLSHFMSLLKNKYGEPEAPYTEVEWVESNGQQFVQLDWYPSSTWGFMVDFSTIDKFPGSGGSTIGTVHTSSTTYYGSIFGTCDTPTSVNDFRLGTYDNGNNGGVVRSGNSKTWNAKLYSDGRRQNCSLIGTTYTNPAGATSTVTKNGSKAAWPMTVFANAQRSNNSYSVNPSATRIYSLKFYDNTDIVVDLVGAYRKSDGCTGLWDKISNHFYPAAGLLKGSDIGDVGDAPTIIEETLGSSPSVVTTNTTATRLWTAASSVIQELKDGQQIILRNRFGTATEAKATELAEYVDSGSSANVYLKLTLADGSETKWYPCYYSNTARLTSHYGAGSEMRLVYRENVVSGASSLPRGWWADASYNTDTTRDGFSDTVIVGKNGMKKYTLCMRDDEDRWTSIVNESTNAVSGKTAYTGGLRLGKILYLNSGSNFAAGSNSGQMNQTYPGMDFRYSVNGVSSDAASTTLELRKPVYLVGTINDANGLFYLDQTKWWAQDLPITEDGKVYLLVGWAYNSYYAIYLSSDHPAYVYKNGRIQELTNGHVVQKDVPPDAVFTDTTYNFSGATFYSGNSNTAEHDANDAVKNGLYYYALNGPATSLGADNDGSLYVQSYNDMLVSQIAQNYRDGSLYVRGKNNGVWQSWQKVYDSAHKPTPADIGAIAKNAEMLTTNPFAPSSYKGPYISKIDNAFYAADKRWTVSAVKSASGGNNTIGNLFNGDYESSYGPSNGATATITIDFAGSGWSYNNIECFPNYPYGYILLSFYYTEIPASVTGRVYCNYTSQGVGWHDLTFSPVEDNTTSSCVYRARQSYYAISKLEITITARESGLTSCTQIEMHLDRPYSGRNPFLSKYSAEELYYNLTAPNFIGNLQGNVTGNCSGTASNVTGTVAVANGGTGQTSAINAANSFLNALTTGSSDPQDADYYISQYAGGGTTTTTFHRRPVSALWNYIKGKISSVLGLTVTQYGGNAATATSATTAGNVTGTVAIVNGGTGATTAAAAWTALGGGAIGKKSSLDASDIPNLNASKITDGTLPVARGGTGATTAAGALTNLGAVPTTRTVNGKPLSSDVNILVEDILFTEDATDFTLQDFVNSTPWNGYNYGLCTTASATAAKTVTISDSNMESLYDGLQVVVRFASGNTASNITLNVNNTGACSITKNGSGIYSNFYFPAGSIYMFTYSGNAWEITGNAVVESLTNNEILSLWNSV